MRTRPAVACRPARITPARITPARITPARITRWPALARRRAPGAASVGLGPTWANVNGWGREMRKMAAAPDVMLGSVAALTEDGTLVAASATGSQLGAYAAGAGRLILVVGTQKLVPDLDAALSRVREVVQPWEMRRCASAWESTPSSARSC